MNSRRDLHVLLVTIGSMIIFSVIIGLGNMLDLDGIFVIMLMAAAETGYVVWSMTRSPDDA